MTLRTTLKRGTLLTTLSLLAGLAGHAAYASDPLPEDAIAPPLNVNIGLYYNEFEDAGTVGAVHGSSYNNDTHISTDVSVFRYVRTFAIGNMEYGVQAFVPYVAFLGEQTAGISNIGSAVPGVLPAYGPGRANLAATSGFGEPNFGAFAFPINDPATGTYMAVGPWIALPVSGFNPAYSLNPGQNVWTYEAEAGFRTTVIGTPKTTNLAVEVWGEAYFFGSNNKSGDVSPTVSANSIPPIYTLAHEAISPLIPDTNPLASGSYVPATFKEQPSQEVRIYLPYTFYPATGAFFAPGLYQSFGGKQTYTLRNGEKVDSGNRTNETQLRFTISSFVTPTIAIMGVGIYDVANHGGPLYRGVELRLAKFF
jgi:hypothetical protein